MVSFLYMWCFGLSFIGLDPATDVELVYMFYIDMYKYLYKNRR